MIEERHPEEIEVQEDEILRQRTDKLMRLREEEGYDPFVHEKWIRKHTLDHVLKNFSHLSGDEKDDTEIVTAGRLMTLRRHGKAAFANLADETSNLQLYFQVDAMGEEEYGFFKKWIDTGDMLGIVGHPFRTRRGELSILVTRCVLLAKALRPLPEKWHGLKDTETRYRQRYVDLIDNPDVRDTFRKRASIISTFRRVLEAHGSLEVETPILATLAGGANARPFVTFHNALGINMYMRIATELYLKRLIVGMLGRVYEIGKNFRNEGIDIMHNPEFTSMEVYWAYADYEDIMDLTEELIVAAADSVGSRDVVYQGTSISFHPPFRRATMAELVMERTGFDIYQYGKEDDEKARAFAREKGVDLEGYESRFLVLTKLFDEFVEDSLIQPTFVLGLPTEVSPLAKKNPEDPNFTNRFELYIYGSEVANAFSELNDPLDQRERFMDQLKKKEAGDDEAHVFDEDYINALEYGLPPTGGLGIGIDRLTMFLTDSRSIRDVILFPTMRPKA
ncbi:MAG TPA: lysine--tRNA ligase [Synergistales bacterium]|nr:lysine--tRNA ligase [Synergistales bacterium]